MARRHPITLVFAVLAFLSGVRFVQTNAWFGFAWIVLSILFTAHFLSASVREFINQNKMVIASALGVGYAILSIYLFNAGNVEFALVFAFGVLILAGLLLLEIWAIRKYDDYGR